MRTIILNSSNYVAGSGNKYTYVLPSSTKFDEKAKIGVASIAVYNSTFNVTSARGNNTISLVWNAATPQTYTFTIPDGYYSLNDLNYFIQQQCILNNLYVTNSSSQNVYFVEIVANNSRYAAQINTYFLPTAATATSLGYTKPSGASWSYPATAACPQITITAAFGLLIGFGAGSYPSTATVSTNQNFVSTSTPNINPIDSYILTCSLLNSPYSIPSDVFFSLPLNGGLGSLITVNPSQIVFNSIAPNYYKEITIRLFDQLFNPLPLQDKELVLTLAILEGNEDK